MAKMSSINKNNRRKEQAQKFFTKRARLKKEIYSKNISLDERVSLVMYLAKLPRNSAMTRVRNRCYLTGRSRGFIRKFSLSRNMMRALSCKGMLPGVVKASW